MNFKNFSFIIETSNFHLDCPKIVWLYSLAWVRISKMTFRLSAEFLIYLLLNLTGPPSNSQIRVSLIKKSTFCTLSSVLFFIFWAWAKNCPKLNSPKSACCAPNQMNREMSSFWWYLLASSATSHDSTAWWCSLNFRVRPSIVRRTEILYLIDLMISDDQGKGKLGESDRHIFVFSIRQNLYIPVLQINNNT